MFAAISFSDLTGWLLPFTLVVGGVIGYMIFRSTFSKENEALKEDLINTRGQKIADQQADIDGLKRRDDEQQKMIDDLRKELKTWRDEPIKQLSEDYKKMVATMEEMSKLIKLLVDKQSGDRPSRRRDTTSK